MEKNFYFLHYGSGVCTITYMAASYSIGIDLGGTNLRAAAVDKDGKMLEKISGNTPVASGPGPVVDDMAQSVEKLREKFGRDGLAGIGAGVPGNIDMAKGVIVGWGNMPIFNGYAMRDELSKRLNTKVILENDANAAALGEQWMGAGRGVDDLVLLTLGTGVGGGIIVDGTRSPWPDRHGRRDRPHDYFAERESLRLRQPGDASKSTLLATAVSAMARLLGLGHDLTAQQVYDLAVKGNDRAREIFKVMGGKRWGSRWPVWSTFSTSRCICWAAAWWHRGNFSPRRCWRKSSAAALLTGAL